jgi:hypothetical protein
MHSIGNEDFVEHFADAIGQILKSEREPNPVRKKPLGETTVTFGTPKWSAKE